MSSGSSNGSESVSSKLIEPWLEPLKDGDSLSPTINPGFALRNFNVSVTNGSAELSTGFGSAVTLTSGMNQGFGDSDNIDYIKDFKVSGNANCIAVVSWEITAI